MCENVNLPSRAPVVASPEGLTGSTTQVYKMDEICEQCRIQLMLRQRRYKSCHLFFATAFLDILDIFPKYLLIIRTMQVSSGLGSGKY